MLFHLHFPVILGALVSTWINYLWVLPLEIFDAQKMFQPETKKRQNISPTLSRIPIPTP